LHMTKIDDQPPGSTKRERATYNPVHKFKDYQNVMQILH
jgi:hypothetical protein